ncbi:Radical SAM superfamily protein [uncultured archaeon]|nr:Radical SAM superfamily protein [uncultured archaeon]
MGTVYAVPTHITFRHCIVPMAKELFHGTAEAAIGDFRLQLQGGKRPLVVFVHPPKSLKPWVAKGNEQEIEIQGIEIFDGAGPLLPFVKISGSADFEEDNNYSPRGGFTPLAFSLLGTILKRAGFEFTILELSHASNPLHVIEELKHRLEAENYAVIWGFTATSPSNFAAMELARVVNDRASIVLFGGVHATVAHEYAIRNCPQLDFVFVGEAEESLPKLLDFIVFGRGSLELILGITYRCKKGIVFGQRERWPGPKIGFSNFEFLSFDRFPDIWGDERVFRVQSARGCNYSCSFCAQAIQLQESSLERIIEYFTYLSEKSGSKMLNIFFEDATFTSNKKRAFEFCRRLAELECKKGISISWGCQTRADCLDAELINEIAVAGCRYVYLGIEAMNRGSLVYVGKGLNFAGYASPIHRMEETLRLLRQEGILIGCSVIVGLPTDTAESLSFTVSRLKDFCVHMIFLESVKVFPQTMLAAAIAKGSGTAKESVISKYYSELAADSLNPEDWNCLLLCPVEKMNSLYEVVENELNGRYSKLSAGLYVMPQNRISEKAENI